MNQIVACPTCRPPAGRIFVFGSNLAGVHGAGAAQHGHTFHSARWGVGRGLTGKCYAIPTKDENIETRALEEIEVDVADFVRFAGENPHMTFDVTRIGCGLAGYTDREIAPMFRGAMNLPNVNLPKEWLEILS